MRVPMTSIGETENGEFVYPNGQIKEFVVSNMKVSVFYFKHAENGFTFRSVFRVENNIILNVSNVGRFGGKLQEENGILRHFEILTA